MPARRSIAFALSLAAAAGCADTVAPDACGRLIQTYTESAYARARLDVLFVVDDGPSMADEQRWLREELPRVARELLESPPRTPGALPFEPVNIHVGVISADLGAGADGFVPGCSARGDDGQLQDATRCAAVPGAFEWNYPEHRDPEASIRAIGCAAQLGASGCRVSQPLEAAVRALDGNAEFWRPLVDAIWSQDLIVFITDQDDCSSQDASLHAPADQLAPDNPLRDVAPELRCTQAEYKLRAIGDYVSELRRLRPDEQAHIGIVAGFPPDLLPAAAAQVTLFDTPTNPARTDLFRRIGADPRMQPQARADRAPGEPPLMPSCSSANATAYPPRRLLDFARRMEGVALGSICDTDLSALVHELVYPDSFGKTLGRSCQLRARLRDADGLISCIGSWELPPEADPEEPFTPQACEDRPDILRAPRPGGPKKGKRGGRLCELRQAAVVRADDGTLTTSGEGFFYYDQEQPAPGLLRCPLDKGDIGFTKDAQPPAGVRVHVQCVDELTPATCSDAG